MPKVSVVVPVYKVEKYLSRCIDSILSQTLTDFELILVDDGSPDNSGKICDEYAKKDARIKVIHKINEGVSIARNTGIDNANGEYLMFVDSDDEIKNDFLEYAIEHNENADWYVSGIKMIFKDGIGQIVKEEIYKATSSSLMSVTELYSNVGDKFPLICICGPCCKLYKLSIIKRENLYFDKDLSLGEDTFFNLSYAKYAKTVFLDEKVFYFYYRGSKDSLFSRYKEDIYEIHEKVYDEWRNLLFYLRVSQKTMEAFENMYLDLMIGCIHHIYKNTKSRTTRRKILESVLNNKWVLENRTYKGNGKQKIIKFLVTKKRFALVNMIFSMKYL